VIEIKITFLTFLVTRRQCGWRWTCEHQFLDDYKASSH